MGIWGTWGQTVPEDLQVPDSPEVLAQSFYGQARRLQRRSNAILAFIILALVVGAASVLYLPPVIANIDRGLADFSLDTEVRNLELGLAEVVDQMSELHEDFVELGSLANQTLSSPVSTWQRENWSHQGRLNAIAVGPGGRLVAVGIDDAWNVGNAIIATRGVNGVWTPHTPLIRGEPIDGELRDVTVGPDGRLIAVGFEWTDNGGRPVVLQQQDDGEWMSIWQSQDDHSLLGELWSVTSTLDGKIVAVGFQIMPPTRDSAWNERLLVMTRSATGDWTDYRPQYLGNDIPGKLMSVTQSDSGLLVAVGTVEMDEWAPEPIILTRQGEASWLVDYPVIKNGDTPLLGELSDVAAAGNSQIVAVGYEEPWDFEQPNVALVVERDSNGNWQVALSSYDETPIEGRLHGIIVGPDNRRIAIGESSSFSDSKLLVIERIGDVDWTANNLSTGGQHVFGAMTHIVEEADNQFVAVGVDTTTSAGGHLIVTSSPVPPSFGDASGVDPGDPRGRVEIRAHAQTIYDHIAHPDVLLPDVLGERLFDSEFVLGNWDSLADRHSSLVATLSKVESALSEADQWHRAGRIATRVAIVALLIYLVQIAVHLYRYNSRLAGYYQARGDAIALIRADSGGKATGVEDVKLPDVVAALSPDGVAFDKASPPTQHLADIAKSSISRTGRD